jgi:hypothetical protein
MQQKLSEPNTEAPRMIRPPATYVNEIWTVEIVQWKCPVILAIDAFSMHPTVAYPTFGTAAHIVSKLDQAAKLAGYPAKLWVSADGLYKSVELEAWANKHRTRILLSSSQSRVTKPLVERLRRDCLDDLQSIALAEMAEALRCWRKRVTRSLTAAE